MTNWKGPHHTHTDRQTQMQQLQRFNITQIYITFTLFEIHKYPLTKWNCNYCQASVKIQIQIKFTVLKQTFLVLWNCSMYLPFWPSHHEARFQISSILLLLWLFGHGSPSWQHINCHLQYYRNFASITKHALWFNFVYKQTELASRAASPLQKLSSLSTNPRM